jgi:outer membrane receptor protein involved in Fe transport
MRLRLLFTVLGISLLVVSLSVQSLAQATISYAQLNGTVLDPSGKAIVKAEVSVRSTDTNQSYTTTTNVTGFYAIPLLPPGRYELTVASTGFAKYTQTGIVLSVGQTATNDITLKVAATGEVVTVTTEAPPIETTRTEISQVIDTQQIQSLPISNRRFTDFALLTPGVASSRTSFGTTFTEFEATQLSFGGMRSFSNIITVDGADFVNTVSGVQRATPPQESVQEFRVVNNSFGTEYGRALGGIVNVVTKSGTNDLHGSVYDYLQNSAANSRSLLQLPGTAFALRQNQFGGTLGGPIVKDRTFFFMNYEGLRRAEAPTLPLDLLLNIQELNLAKANIGINVPENLGILKTNDNDYGFARLDHQINNNNRFAVRYNVEDARDLNTLVGQTEDGGGIGTPSAGRNLFIRDQSLVGTLNTVIRPNLVNTFLAQYARRHYNFPGATGQPDLSFGNDLEFGHNFGTYDGIFESREQFSDSIAWVKGNHVVKFGYDSNYLQDRVNYPGFTPTRIIFPDLNCFIDFANTLALAGGGLSPIPGPPCPLPNGQDPLPPFVNFEGVAAIFYGVALSRNNYVDGQFPLNNQFPLDTTTWANAFPPGLSSSYDYKLNHGYQGFFFQDQWRVTPKLTFNYGLRWDFETGLGRHIDSYYKSFQPRVGFAYSPDNKTVIRAGFGIFVDRVNMVFFFTPGNQKTVAGYLPGITLPMVQSDAAHGGWQLNLAVSPGNIPPGITCTQGIPDVTPCFSLAADLAASILTTGLYPQEFITDLCLTDGQGACYAGAGGVDRHISKPPYAEQASLQIEREIGKGLTLGAGYLMVQSHRLVQGNGINEHCPVGTSKPDPNAQGLLNADGTLSNCNGTPSPLLFGKPYFGDTGGLEFGNAGFLDYNNDVDNAIYHGLTIHARERVGSYFTLDANYTFSHTIDSGNFTTFINLPQNQFDPAAERANSNQDVRHRFVLDFTAEGPKNSFLRNFALSSIINAQTGRPFTLFTGTGDSNGDSNPVTDRPGLVGRNTYYGDHLYSWDLRVSRYFQLGERKRLDLAFDAFNLLNRQNIDEVVSVYGGPEICGATPTRFNDAATRAIQAGQVSCPAVAPPPNAPPADAAWFVGSPFVPPPNEFLGTPRAMLNPRQLQISVKFSF